MKLPRWKVTAGLTLDDLAEYKIEARTSTSARDKIAKRLTGRSDAQVGDTRGFGLISVCSNANAKWVRVIYITRCERITEDA